MTMSGRGKFDKPECFSVTLLFYKFNRAQDARADWHGISFCSVRDPLCAIASYLIL